MQYKTQVNIPTHLETARLYLRRYQAGDGQWYVDVCHRNKQHLARFEANNPVMTVMDADDAENVIGDFVDSWGARRHFFMGAWEKATDTFVAQIYIGPVNWNLPEFEIGYFVDVDHEGKGYVTEAVQGVLAMLFQELNTHRVMIRCNDTNGRSARVAERCGFVREGHLRENNIHSDGTITGSYVYGLLRQEFIQARG